ncbi:MAG: FAD-dependent oxidoreductase [Candidatus Portnoybacteria bacterium]
MNKIYDLIIVGAGPAGVTAGIYAARQRLDALLITKGFGGQMTRKAVPIENYPGLGEISSTDLIRKFEKDLKRHKIEITTDSVSRIRKDGNVFSVLAVSRKTYKSKTVIVASGADPRPLEVPGEKKFIGKGVSYCVACDGPLFTGKDVVVAGGGNSAFESTLLLQNYVNKIYIIERAPKFRADKENQARVEKTGKVELILNATLKKVVGDTFVNSVFYQDNKTKKTIKLEVSGIFVEIGSQPATSFVKGLVDFSKKDEIMINHRTTQTKTPGLFAAGDVSDCSFKQIVVAAGEGAKASMAVSGYLQKVNL